MKVSTKWLVKYTISIVLAMSLIGCTVKPAPPFEITSPDRGMIYGNIRILGHEVTEIELREFGRFYMPPFSASPRVMVYRNGNFVAENLVPGNYFISRFVSNKLLYTLVNDERSAYQWIIKVEPGSIKFAGTFEIADVTPNEFKKGKFNIKSVRHPSERKVLHHIFQITEGTGWQSKIKRRIKSLR